MYLSIFLPLSIYWHYDCRKDWHMVNLYDAYPGDGAEGLPRKWVTTTVGNTQPYIGWRVTDSQPDGYGPGLADSE